MHKNIAIVFLLIFFGCGGPQHHEVMVNKTVKVFSEDYHEKAENYTFKWQPPIGPMNEEIIFNLKNDMLIFTPLTIGIYKINLSIEDISEQVVSKQIFYFKAIPETVEVAIIDPRNEIPSDKKPNIIYNKPKKQHPIKTPNKNNNKKITKKSSKKKIQRSYPNKNNKKYAIQISSWPSLEEARKHQLELIDKGFDAYIQNFYSNKDDQVWYRVRLGNYSNIDKALIVKNNIESITGITTWLDIVSTQ